MINNYLLVAILLCKIVYNFGFTLDKKGQSQCYIIDSKDNNFKLDFRYTAVDGNKKINNNFNFTIFDYKTKKILIENIDKASPAKGYDLNIFNETETFKFCFNNSDSDVKNIYFYYNFVNFKKIADNSIIIRGL